MKGFVTMEIPKQLMKEDPSLENIEELDQNDLHSINLQKLQIISIMIHRFLICFIESPIPSRAVMLITAEAPDSDVTINSINCKQFIKLNNIYHQYVWL
ncbi:uncharacterized protein LOC143810127 [Ranitomeya variabilis]|uniref:uncharacterized protein LOC143810127 n=1 Tax=Ranitomeya variabilis TaxID=490064 RepID=UPI0040570B27